MAQGLHVEIQKPLTLEHEGMIVHRAYVLDLLVEEQVIVEIKSVSKIAPVHVAQLLTYLKLTGLQVGLIINFDVTRLVDGVKRVVNNYVDDSNANPATNDGPAKQPDSEDRRRE